MEDFGEMVSRMLQWTDNNLKVEELDCLKTLQHPSATDADKAEARQVLRAIQEARKERKLIAAARAKWEEIQEGEQLARIELYKDEAKAMMQAERQPQQPQQTGAHPMSPEDRKKIAECCEMLGNYYCKDENGERGVLIRTEQRVLNAVKGKKIDAAALIHADFMLYRVKCSWNAWQKLWSDGIGCEIQYRPSTIKDYLKGGNYR